MKKKSAKGLNAEGDERQNSNVEWKNGQRPLTAPGLIQVHLASFGLAFRPKAGVSGVK